MVKIVTTCLEAVAIVLGVAGALVLFGAGWALVAAGAGVGVYAWRLS